eukprot:6331307-Amphidinium_carterae.1
MIINDLLPASLILCELEVVFEQWLITLPLSFWFLLALLKVCIEERVLPFRSTGVFAGKSRICFGCFAGESCEGLATVEVKMDTREFISFLLAQRVLSCLSVVVKPKIKSEAGTLLVRAIKELADQQGFNVDFEPVQDVSGGRYWVLGRSL